MNTTSQLIGLTAANGGPPAPGAGAGSTRPTASSRERHVGRSSCGSHESTRTPRVRRLAQLDDAPELDGPAMLALSRRRGRRRAVAERSADRRQPVRPHSARRQAAAAPRRPPVGPSRASSRRAGCSVRASPPEPAWVGAQAARAAGGSARPWFSSAWGRARRTGSALRLTRPTAARPPRCSARASDRGHGRPTRSPHPGVERSSRQRQRAHVRRRTAQRTTTPSAGTCCPRQARARSPLGRGVLRGALGMRHDDREALARAARRRPRCSSSSIPSNGASSSNQRRPARALRDRLELALRQSPDHVSASSPPGSTSTGIRSSRSRATARATRPAISAGSVMCWGWTCGVATIVSVPSATARAARSRLSSHRLRTVVDAGEQVEVDL